MNYIPIFIFIISYFIAFDVVSVSHTGSLYTLVVRGEREDAERGLSAFAPVFSEFLPLSLEEVFVREMEAVGYDFEEIIF